MNRDSITVKAPAKLNLYLDVVGRRVDGYHDLETVMQTVSLYNTVCVTAAEPGVRLTCDHPGLPTDARNTAYRAAEAFAKAAGIEPRWHIDIRKGIPHEAGMGSASADAAGVLVGLNALYDAPLAEEALLAVAVTIGADVPFLLKGGTMLCKGIGDAMAPLDPLNGLWFVVVKGEQGFSTPEVFARFDKQEPPGIFLVDGLQKALEENRPNRVAKHLANRLEYCLFDTPIAEYKMLMMQCGALGAAMTGSGSAAFGAFVSEPQAHVAARDFRSRAQDRFGGDIFVDVVRPVAHGPIAGSL